MRKLIFLMMIFFACAFLTGNSYALSFNVILSWDANSEPDLAGYRVYRSETSGSYNQPIAEIGLETTYTDTINVNDGETKILYYVVTAFDQTDLESDYSNEVFTSLDGNEPPDPVNNLIINVQIVVALQSDGSYTVAMREMK